MSRKRGPRPVSCRRCYILHVRCDRVRPTCGRCSSSNKECTPRTAADIEAHSRRKRNRSTDAGTAKTPPPPPSRRRRSKTPKVEVDPGPVVTASSPCHVKSDPDSDTHMRVAALEHNVQIFSGMLDTLQTTVDQLCAIVTAPTSAWVAGKTEEDDGSSATSSGSTSASVPTDTFMPTSAPLSQPVPAHAGPGGRAQPHEALPCDPNLVHNVQPELLCQSLTDLRMLSSAAALPYSPVSQMARESRSASLSTSPPNTLVEDSVLIDVRPSPAQPHNMWLHRHSRVSQRLPANEYPTALPQCVVDADPNATWMYLVHRCPKYHASSGHCMAGIGTCFVCITASGPMEHMMGYPGGLSGVWFDNIIDLDWWKYRLDQLHMYRQMMPITAITCDHLIETNAVYKRPDGSRFEALVALFVLSVGDDLALLATLRESRRVSPHEMPNHLCRFVRPLSEQRQPVYYLAHGTSLDASSLHDTLRDNERERERKQQQQQQQQQQSTSSHHSGDVNTSPHSHPTLVKNPQLLHDMLTSASRAFADSFTGPHHHVPPLAHMGTSVKHEVPQHTVPAHNTRRPGVTSVSVSPPTTESVGMSHRPLLLSNHVSSGNSCSNSSTPSPLESTPSVPYASSAAASATRRTTTVTATATATSTTSTSTSGRTSYVPPPPTAPSSVWEPIGGDADFTLDLSFDPMIDFDITAMTPAPTSFVVPFPPK